MEKNLDAAVAHLKQVKCVFTVCTTARQRSRTGKILVIQHYKVKNYDPTLMIHQNTKHCRLTCTSPKLLKILRTIYVI